MGTADSGKVPAPNTVLLSEPPEEPAQFYDNKEWESLRENTRERLPDRNNNQEAVSFPLAGRWQKL